jgi:sugar lactone lactonase YvrE
MPAFLAASERAKKLAPTSPHATFDLACAYARNGRANEAIAELEQLVLWKSVIDVEKEDDFASLRALPAFRAVVTKLDAIRRTQIGTGGEVLARFSERTLTTEGIAYDDSSGALFVGSAHLRKILRVAPTGSITEWKQSGEDGLEGVLGMDIDPARGLLFACSTADREVEGFSEADSPHAEIVAFELATKKLVLRAVLTGQGEHACNDLAVDRDGSVLASDTGTGALWKLAKDGGLGMLVEPGKLLSPQAIAIGEDALFIADYPRGVARVERATGEVKILPAPTDAVVSGIDGMRAVTGGFVAIQNGIEPHRVVFLASDGHSIERVTVLAMNDPRWHEPTLGAIVGRDLVYVAAAQWGAFDKDGHITHPESLAEPILMRMTLP